MNEALDQPDIEHMTDRQLRDLLGKAQVALRKHEEERFVAQLKIVMRLAESLGYELLIRDADKPQPSARKRAKGTRRFEHGKPSDGWQSTSEESA